MRKYPKLYQVDWETEIVPDTTPKDIGKIATYYFMVFASAKHILTERHKKTTAPYQRANIVRICEYFWGKAMFYHREFYNKDFATKEYDYNPLHFRRHGYKQSNLPIDEIQVLEQVFAKQAGVKKLD